MRFDYSGSIACGTVFVLIVTGILYLNQLLYCEEQVQCALEQAAKETSLEYTLVHKKLVVNPVFMSAKINAPSREEKMKTGLSYVWCGLRSTAKQIRWIFRRIIQ